MCLEDLLPVCLSVFCLCSCTKEGEVGGSSENICNWPNLHTDIKESMEEGTYWGVAPVKIFFNWRSRKGPFDMITFEYPRT